MTRRVKKHMAISVAAMLAMTAVAAIIMTALGKTGMPAVAIALGAFYSIANVCSFVAREALTHRQSGMITTFYLADLTVRFLASAVFIGTLIYLNRADGLATGIMSFVFYVAAMVLEISYFFAVERNNGTQNA